jgi:hypothetical protein
MLMAPRILLSTSEVDLITMSAFWQFKAMAKLWPGEILHHIAEQ